MTATTIMASAIPPVTRRAISRGVKTALGHCDYTTYWRIHHKWAKRGLSISAAVIHIEAAREAQKSGDRYNLHAAVADARRELGAMTRGQCEANRRWYDAIRRDWEAACHDGPTSTQDQEAHYTRRRNWNPVPAINA